MSVAAAETLVLILGLYVAVGVVFAAVFVAVGVTRIDPDAEAMPLRARAIVFPGAVGLWPLLLAYMVRGKRTS